MLKLIVIFFVALSACYAENSAPPVVCGPIPSKFYKCLNAPSLVEAQAQVTSKCVRQGSECDKISCTFTEQGWLEGSKLNKKKLSDHYDQYAHDHPEWASAIAHIKTDCVSRDLPAQTVLLNCPAYDALFSAAFAGFMKHASPSQWSSSPECRESRAFAAACPACPEDCFATQIPIGSCNACLSLPRSP